MTTKLVINEGCGGFGLSLKCVKYMAERDHHEAQRMLKNHEAQPRTAVSGDEYFIETYEGHRHDPLLVEAVEALGREAEDDVAELVIKEIEGTKYLIKEYDGWETLVEPDDIDWISRYW